MVILEIGEHAFKCPFCGNEYTEFEGRHYSEEVSKKGTIRLKCYKCKERFAVTSNIKGDLVTYKDPIIKDRKAYDKEYNKKYYKKNTLKWSEKELKYVKVKEEEK